MRKGLSLYLHIPFCNSKCNYCSFVSVVAKDDVKLRYLNCLKKEIELRGKEFGASYIVTTIYIGGGTPSCLPNGEIKSLLKTVYKSFTVKNDAEITIEINPNSLTKEKINEYLFAGVNRFSLGLQTSNDKLLKVMGRPDSSQNFINAVNSLRELGATNISADLIIGYPTQTISDVKTSLNLLVKLNIPHVSVYMLSVEEKTKLKDQIGKGELKQLSEDEVVKMMDQVSQTLKFSDYERYEVSNFAKPGFASRHNKVYWQRLNYLGLGVAAHSYLKNQRFANTSDLVKYIGFLEKGDQIPVCDVKLLSKEESMEEMIMLSLRTSEGLNLDKFYLEFKVNFVAKNKAKIANFIKAGYLVLNQKTNSICATDKGFMVLNKIISELVF